MAPELWRLDFEHEKDLSANVENGIIVSLPLPGGIDPKAIQDLTWGDASFAGPCHDIIVCDVDGASTLDCVLHYRLLTFLSTRSHQILPIRAERHQVSTRKYTRDFGQQGQ